MTPFPTRWLAASLLVPPSLAAAQTNEWVAPGPDIWHNPLAWSLLHIPQSGEIAFFPTAGQCGVHAFAACSELFLTFGTDITVFPQGTLAIGGGALANPAGRITLSGGETDNAVLTFGDAATIFDGAGQHPYGQIHLDAFNESRLFSAQINDGAGGELTFEGSLEILGTGLIDAAFTNNSTRGIYANIPGRTLDLGGGVKTNNGLMTAINGGILRVRGLVHQGNRAAGIIEANGGTVELVGATIIGGTVRNIGGLITVDGSVTFENLDLSGPLHIPSGSSFTIRLPGIHCDGPILVNEDGGSAATSLVAASSFAQGAAVLDGPGEIVLNADIDTNLNAASIVINTGNELVVSAKQSIRGTGVIRGNGLCTNLGTLLADRPGRTLSIETSFHNAFRVLGLPGTKLRINSGGTFTQDPASDIDADHIELVRGRIIGGQITAGLITVEGTGDPILEDLDIEADTDILSGEVLYWRGSIGHTGTTTVNADRGPTPTFLDMGTDNDRVDGPGTILLTAESLANIESARISVGQFDTFTNGPGHTVTGNGQFSGSNNTVNNEGVFAPGIPGARDDEPGCLSFNSCSYIQTATGRLEIDIRGTRGMIAFDQLTLNKPVTLDGTLAVIPAPGFAPADGQTFDIIVATGRTGEFETVDAPTVGGMRFEVEYHAAGVRLHVVGCPADLTGDGAVDFFDVQQFLNLFAAQDPRADFAQDGLFDFFDVQAYLLAFSAGCP